MWLFYQFVLGAAFFVVVAFVRVREHEGAADQKEGGDPEVRGAEAAPPAAEAARESRCVWFAKTFVPMYSSIRLAWNTPSLRRLYMASFFLFFSGDVVFDLGSLYFRDELGLLHHSTLEQQQTVSVLATLPPQLFVIPATAFTGMLAQRWGSMTLLKLLIPVSGFMTAGGVLLAIIPRIWVVPIVCLMLNVASLASNVPLKHLVTEAAPAGRVGEAMGTLGMVSQAISFLANGVVAATTPVMYAHMTKPLWTYYILCGALTFLALLPLCGIATAAKDEAEDLAKPAGGKDRTMSARSFQISEASTRADEAHLRGRTDTNLSSAFTIDTAIDMNEDDREFDEEQGLSEQGVHV
eukprot:SRR837773.3079.p1 GENE.SRR837773.3079~~SRR837773.3079.p1  ORF type:complete len:360 (+),score=111.99 SRR837773.3079:25-1080(+)